MNRINVCFLIVCLFASPLIAEPIKGIGYQPNDFDDLVEYYRKSGDTKFDNFHHEYLMMMWNLFPNLRLETEEAKNLRLNLADLMNPQNFINYDDLYSTPALDASRQISDNSKVSTIKKIKALIEAVPHNQLGESAYKKKGYYQYFKRFLEKKNAPRTVAICVRKNLGARQSLNNLGVDELKERFRSIYNEIFIPLLGEEKADELYSLRECFGLFVDKDQLNYLDQHDKVLEIYPPELRKLDFRLAEKSR